jgi:hypothetical protein
MQTMTRKVRTGLQAILKAYDGVAWRPPQPPAQPVPVQCGHVSYRGSVCALTPGHRTLHRNKSGDRWSEVGFRYQ